MKNVVAGDSVGAISSHDIHHADLALLWLACVEGVATQIADLGSDSRREVQSVNPLDGKDILIVGVWARRIGNNPFANDRGLDSDGSLSQDRFWLNASIGF